MNYQRFGRDLLFYVPVFAVLNALGQSDKLKMRKYDGLRTWRSAAFWCIPFSRLAHAKES
jgi:hypothetical protein